MISPYQWRSCMVAISLVGSAGSARAQSSRQAVEQLEQALRPDRITYQYQLPTKEVKLEAKHRDKVLSAKTVVVLATVRPLLTSRSKSSVVVTYRAGRVGPEKAKSEVEAALEKWGRFTVVQDPAQADLALLVLEETLSPHWGSTGDDDPRPRYRLRNTLGVFPVSNQPDIEPIWVGIVTENMLAAELLLSPSATGVIDKLRRDVERAASR